MENKICFPYKEEEKYIPQFVKEMTQVYNRMSDEISREIFVNRLLMSLTGNYKYMNQVTLYTKGGRNLNNVIQKSKATPQYIYGAGIRGKRLLDLFPDNNWGGFIDKYSAQESYRNVKIMSLEHFLTIYKPGTPIFISNKLETRDIIYSLLEMRILSDDIYVINNFDQDGAEDIYFSLECLREKLEGEKAFVDIGCFDGKDSLNYMKWSGNNKAKIYAFEPDIKNYEVCKRKLDGHLNIELFNIGLSDREEEVYIAGEGDMSCLGSSGNIKVRTKLLDDVIQNIPIGFIKMDVEGYEEKVLRGAEKIIRTQHPIMAISLYHKKSDIWRIPTLLLKFYNYRFYMRYYGAANGDTVLYAYD